MNIQTTLKDPRAKRQYNRSLFKTVAPAYQNVTVLLSLGRDRFWKRFLVSQLPDCDTPLIVDVAAGTGDLTLAIGKRYPDGRVLGADLTFEMVSIAQCRTALHNVKFSLHDMCSIGLRSGTVDIVTGGYALRNAPDLPATIAEVNRLLKSGGTAAFLDFSQSPNRILQVFPALPTLSSQLTAGTGTIGLRVSSHPLARQLCTLAGGAITATSANRSGHQPAQTEQEVVAQFGDDVDWIVKGGVTRGGLASTIIAAISGGGLRLVREGVITFADACHCLDTRNSFS